MDISRRTFIKASVVGGVGVSALGFDLRRAQAAADRFGYAWGGDYVALMGLILEGRVCGTNDAEFHYRMSTPATQPYRPVDRAALITRAARATSS